MEQLKQYKVFYMYEEVGEFNTLKEATAYIYSQLKIDKYLSIKDFTIYSRID